MLIDDDEDESDFFLLALQELPPVKYRFADNARQGLAMLKAERPDLVLLDINMPAMNGMECLKEIRRTEGLKDVPVFIYSNSDEEKMQRTAIANGANGCFKKPQSMDDLKNLLKSILRHG